MMIKDAEIPVTKACSGLGMGRSSYYKIQGTKKADEPYFDARGIIQNIALEYPFYGYRRITAEMHRRGQSINHKKVLSIMRNDNLLCIRKKFRIITTDSNHNLPVFQNLIKDIEKSALKQLNPHNSA